MINFIKEWLNYGKGKEPIFSFLCNYIAFNCLYGKYPLERDGHRSELNQIQNMLDKELPILNKQNFSPYKILNDDSEIIKRPVKSMRSQTQILRKDLNNHNIYKLFESIYIIRCNFFHGEKQLYNERDRKLITEANSILSYFLEEYIKIK